MVTAENENKNINIILNNIENEVPHSHQAVELIYVIEGCAKLQTGTEAFEMKKDALVLVNSGQKHSMKILESGLLFRVYMPYGLLTSLCGEDYVFFVCNSVMNLQSSYQKVRAVIEDMVIEYLNNDGKITAAQLSLSYALAAELLENYKADKDKLSLCFESTGNERLDKALHYIQLHYAQPVSLSDIAGSLHISDSYLSRFFKNETGKNFVDYVNDVRLEHALWDLMNTERPMTVIAVDNGFSTPSVFCRLFKKKYGATPTEYKNALAVKRPKEQKTVKKENLNGLRQLFMEKKQLRQKHKEQPVKNIAVDVYGSAYLWHNKNSIINIGDATVVSEAKTQEHILYLAEQLNFEYARIWNLFPSKFMISKDFSGSHFNFEYLDRIFDFFVQHKIKMFLDFGKRDRVMRVSFNSVYYSVNEQSVLKNKAEWENLIDSFVRHLVRRYGQGVLENWIFEFPIGLLPYYEENFEYIQAYEAGYRIIRKNISNAGVAGPGAADISETENLKKIIREMKRRQCVPDIFTIKVFPYHTHQTVNELMHQKTADYLYLRHFVEKTRALMEEEKINCSLCVAEWTNSISNRSPIQDSCARGTYIIQNILSVWTLVDMMGFWHCSDTVDVYYDSRKLLLGGGGILTKDGIRKPSFYAFYFLKYMDKHLLKIGNHYMITKNDDGNIHILCFNHRDYSAYYYLKDENTYKINEMDKLFISEDPVFLDICLRGMESDCSYMIKERVINENHGSILNEWQALDYEEDLGSEDIQYLKQICVPKVLMKHTVCRGTQLNIHVKLEPHEMRLIHIYKY